MPEGLTALDLDTVRLTAQFVARNGKAFLTGLATREAGNPHFNFLKPTHSLFGFFTALCDAYSRVLMPPKGLAEQLRQDATDRRGPRPFPSPTAGCPQRWLGERAWPGSCGRTPPTGAAPAPFLPPQPAVHRGGWEKGPGRAAAAGRHRPARPPPLSFPHSRLSSEVAGKASQWP